jgi:hypothetical protein
LIGKEIQEMVKARVQLTGSATWSGHGYHFRKGESKIITRPSDVLFFKNAGGFSVTMLEGKAPRHVAPPTSEPEPEPDSSPSVEVEVEESDGPATPELKRSDLEQQTKASLIQLAEELELDPPLDRSARKSDMIDRILESQS